MTIKMKMLPRFPISLTAASPILLTTTGGAYVIDFDMDVLLATVDGLYVSDADLIVDLALKADIASPTFTGVPAAPTAAPGTSTTQLATTAFVTTADDLKANLASPTFTGVPAAPTAAAATSTTQIATTAFVTTADNLKANLASPTFTGVPAAPTAAAATNTTQLATTEFVTTADNLKANIASPTFTGVPAAPTAAVSTNTTQLATTAFVTTAVAGAASVNQYILNGAMMVSQENGTAAGTTSAYYPVDQFALYFSNGGTVSVAQVASVTPAGSPNRIRVTATAADAAVAAGDYCQIRHAIEGLHVADLMAGTASAKTITIQFGVKAPAGTYCVSIRNSALNRSYNAEYVISGGEANTDVVKSVTLTLDTSGTWLTTTGLGLEVSWVLMAGTTYQATTATWAAGSTLASASQFNFMGTINNVFELFDVSLIAGSTSPAFRVPDFVIEERLCKRYWQAFTSLLVETAAAAQSNTTFHVPMRAVPTVTGGGAGFANGQPTAQPTHAMYYQTTRAYQDLKLSARL